MTTELFSTGFIGKGIPKELLQPDEDDSSLPSLYLFGEEAREFREILADLRHNRTTEYLKDKELEAHLWFLCCDVFLNTLVYSESGKLKARVKGFFQDLCLPLQEYQVFIAILHFDIQEPSLHVWDFTITKFTHEGLLEIIAKFPENFQDHFVQDFTKHPVMILREQGNNKTLIVERAREKARFNLKVLQTYFSKSLGVNDQQVLFDISEGTLLKNINNPNDIGARWIKKRVPYGLTYTAHLEEYTSLSNSHFMAIQSAPPKIRSAVERAVYWIGTAIEESEYDQKIIALCTAIEAFLTTRDDKQKGETLTYRMILLTTFFSEGFPDPFKFLWLYELRSMVIHGSDVSVCTYHDYVNMLWTVRETLNYFVQFVTQEHCKSIAEVAKQLEHSSKVSQLLEWLEQQAQYDKAGYYQAIRDALAQVVSKNGGD